MADDPKKNPNEQSGEPRHGQESEPRQRDQQDTSKRQPTRPDQNLDQDEEDNNQQQGGQRRAS